jgi:hypothetical protein
LYDPERTEATYERLWKLATQTLAASRVVILDATFLDGRRRERLAAVAREAGVPLVLVETVCGEDTAVGRILRPRRARRLTLGRHRRSLPGPARGCRGLAARHTVRRPPPRRGYRRSSFVSPRPRARGPAAGGHHRRPDSGHVEPYRQHATLKGHCLQQTLSQPQDTPNACELVTLLIARRCPPHYRAVREPQDAMIRNLGALRCLTADTFLT